jgi:hypothetical protein
MPFARVDRLEVGDVLLYDDQGVVSDGIKLGEQFELGVNPPGRPEYSHAALFAGRGAQGTYDVVEMLHAEGFTRRSFDLSKEGALRIDVYRRPGLNPQQGQSIVGQALSYHPPGGRPYANGQIAVLVASVADQFWGAPVDWLADYEDVFDYGKERMICSELVAWAYHDAQIHLRVLPWPDLYSDGVWTTVERQMDYTTPNMLARSPDLAFQFVLWPAVGPG